MKGPLESDIIGLVPNRACRNCVQIKVKCSPQSDSLDNVCQRCHRLRKVCTTPAPVLRKQRVKSTRVRQLEQRVDQLTALVQLESSAQPLTPISAISPVQPDEPTTSARPSVAVNQDTDTPIPRVEGTANGGTEATDCQTSCCVAYVAEAHEQPPSVPTGSPIMHIARISGRKDGSQLLKEYFCPVHIGIELEHWLFDEFRNNMAQHFPFVVIDKNIPCESMKSLKPFTYWACILAASHRDRKLHSLLHDEMLKAVGHRMFIAGDKSLDMLQGLLLMTAWVHNISHINPQLMNLIHLTQALLADMGFLKPIRVHERIRVASDCATFMHGKESATVQFATEEKRALLGFYCLSWKSALTFDRIDPMRYSQHIENCCEDLKSESDHASDMLIIALVQLYSIVSKFFHVDSASTNSSSMYRTMFLDEIRRFRHSVPAEIKGDHMLELEILGSSLCVIEPSYTTSYQNKLEHLDAFHNCVDIGDRLVEALTNIPNEQYPNTTILVIMALVQVMAVCSRLTFFKSGSWDTHYSCSNVKLDFFLERLIEKYTKIQQLEIRKYPQYEAWRYHVYVHKASRIKDWYKSKVSAEQAVFDSTTDEMMPNAFSDNPFGTFDESFWQALGSNWNDFGCL